MIVSGRYNLSPRVVQSAAERPQHPWSDRPVTLIKQCLCSWPCVGKDHVVYFSSPGLDTRVPRKNLVT
jgi:hypothetical protein